MTESLLNLKQIAQYLRLNRLTVYRLIKQGKFPYLKVGGQYRFSLRMIDDWLAKGF